MLALDFLDLLFVLLVQVLHPLDVLLDGHLLAVYAILMRPVEVALLSELLPS